MSGDNRKKDDDDGVHLANAVIIGDYEKVKLLLDKGVSRNCLFRGRTLLSHAASLGYIDVLRLLLEPYPKEDTALVNLSNGNNGYYVVVRDADETNNLAKSSSIEELSTPESMRELEWDSEVDNAVEPKIESEDVWSNQYKWYAKILSETPTITDEANNVPKCVANAQDSSGRSALHYAAIHEQLTCMELLLESGCKVDLGDVDALTPLHFAANRGHIDAVRLLLAWGAKVNAKSMDKMSPLHYAASRGHANVVTELIAHGAHLNSLDAGERTPLKLAASRDLYEIVKILVDAKAKVNIEDVKGYTALCEAVWQKNVAMAKLLLDAGAKLTPTPYLLHYAILHRHAEMVELLLNAAAIVNIKDDQGSTPLIVAAITSQPNIVRQLLSHGAQVDFCGGLSCKTPLMSVLEADTSHTDLEVIKELIEGGANLDYACWGMTPTNYALIKCRYDAAVLLLSYGATVHPGKSTLPPQRVCTDTMFIARKVNAVCVAQAIVMTGYDLWRYCPDISPPSESTNTSNVEGYLKVTKHNPLKLAEIARISVRRCWSKGARTMSSFVKSLGLPPLIQQYLMFSDIRRQN